MLFSFDVDMYPIAEAPQMASARQGVLVGSTSFLPASFEEEVKLPANLAGNRHVRGRSGHPGVAQDDRHRRTKTVYLNATMVCSTVRCTHMPW